MGWALGGEVQKEWLKLHLLFLLTEQCEVIGLLEAFDTAFPCLAGRLLQIWSVCTWNMKRMMIFPLQDG